jgi:hypothetical protein
MEIWRLQDVLHKPFATLKELPDVRSWLMRFLLMKKGKAEGFITILRAPSPYHLKAHSVL